MENKALIIDSIEKRFGSVHAVNGLSLSVPTGEIFGFLGANGAGKTTTIKMLLGFFPPDAGSIKVFGGSPGSLEIRGRIGYMPETAYYYPYLTARELLSFYGGLCGMDKSAIRKRTDELLDRVGLEKAAWDRQLKHFSKGMLQRAGIAQALLHDPELLILDEPLTGLDPLARIHFRDLILDLKKHGKTIFFSSHDLSEAELICDRVTVMRGGRLAWSGSASDVSGGGERNLERVFLDILNGRIPGNNGDKEISK